MMAERVGFEPTNGVNRYTISSRAPSTNSDIAPRECCGWIERAYSTTQPRARSMDFARNGFKNQPPMKADERRWESRCVNHRCTQINTDGESVDSDPVLPNPSTLNTQDSRLN